MIRYQIGFEAAAAAYMLILCCFAWVQYHNRTAAEKEFVRMACLAFAADVLDVASAVGISNGARIAPALNVLFSTGYFAVAALLGIQTVRYSLCYLIQGEGVKKMRSAIWGVGGLYFILLLCNCVTGIVFSFPDGVYTHGRLYYAVYLVPVFYMFCTAVILVTNYGRLRSFQRKSLEVLIILSFTGSLLQGLLFTDTLLTVFFVTLAICIIYFAFETPDYDKLLDTQRQLEMAKEETEIQRAAAQNANFAKTEFLANMSHELRTPIHAILGYDEQIIQDTGESRTAECAINIESAGRKLLSKVNDILDFSAMMDGTLSIDEVPYQTASLLQDALAYMEYDAAQRNLGFSCDIAEQIPQELIGDATRLMQIFSNLSGSAVKAADGEICISVGWYAQQEDAGAYRIRIQNGGQRYDSSQENLSESLEISIAGRLIEQMQGYMEMERETEEPVLYAEIPQRIKNAAPIGKFLRQEKGHREPGTHLFCAPGAKILVVDDNRMNLEVFAGNLRQTRIQIDTAESGFEALKRLQDHRYHLVLLDHMMPGMDGIQTLHELRRQKIAEDTPVIVLTANAVPGAKESYLAEGFDGYLSKPVGRKELLDVIRRFLPEKLIQTGEKNSSVNTGQTPLQMSAVCGQQNPEEKEEKEEKPDPQKQDVLQQLSFLDTQTGLMYCGDSEEFYLEILNSYCDGDKTQELCGFFDEEDWDAYRISIHALKSTSLSIGALTLSEEAKQLEQAAKEKDAAWIREHHAETMEHYQNLLAQIREVLQGTPEASAEADSNTDADVQQGRILIVDDDAMNLQVAEQMLAGKFFCSFAKSGPDAFAQLESEVPDLILLDLHMPQMNGFEVMERLRSDAVYREIPVIFLTADNDRETEIQGFMAGAQDFIKKPFVRDIMIQRISRILELNRLQKHLQQEVDRQTRISEERREKVERLSLQLVLALSSAVKAKNPYTNGHSMRVADYSREIAKRMGKSTQEQDQIYYMGLLHDVGKIGIPDEIINKTGRLTDEEFAIIRRHPLIGADILKNVSEMPALSTGTRGHHERYDGKGYPDGLKGEQIPLEARIIAVADSYDAMTSRRSYRDILPQDVVRGEIEKGKGTQFDPQITDIMLAMIDEDVEYRMTE